jgi:hypothetical protein
MLIVLNKKIIYNTLQVNQANAIIKNIILMRSI